MKLVDKLEHPENPARRGGVFYGHRKNRLVLERATTINTYIKPGNRALKYCYITNFVYNFKTHM